MSTACWPGYNDRNLALDELYKNIRKRCGREKVFASIEGELSMNSENRTVMSRILATLVFARYVILELARRSTKEPRTLDTLFHGRCDELRQTGFAEALALLLNS